MCIKRNKEWEYFLGTKRSTLALPDYYANYFAYSFDRQKSQRASIGLRITGLFAYARYMSYNIYDAEQGSSLGALTDFQIIQSQGNVNPYLVDSDPMAENRKYVINIVPKTCDLSGLENCLVYDISINVLTVIVRYYLPLDGDETGNVPLPQIEAFDINSGENVKLPPLYSLRNTSRFAYRERMNRIFDVVIDDKLRFYKVAGSGQFNNADNAYLICAVKKAGNEVLILKIKPPSYPHDNKELETADVRYWSINEGNPNTSTPTGIPDKQFTKASDGFIYIVIGDKSISHRADEIGYNFMPWKVWFKKGVILYRNLITNPEYKGSLKNVPTLDLDDKGSIYTSDAKNFIGDYAPTGIKISKSDFMKNSGSMASPGFVVRK
ncbi:MAG: hypothetical protein JXJ04_10120 [Spirochaetales bacterium]|nr:hypothetical protein [Spirochaetales bacterium]